MKCRSTRSTSRIRLDRNALTAAAALAAFLSWTGLAAPQQGILPPDSAARPFLEGRELAEKGRYSEAIPKLEKALQTGHERPQESFGTSRHAVDFYDPHYWLGVALMETGQEAKALAHLRLSLAGGTFPNRRETEDRARRIAELARREAARNEPPPREPTPAPLPSPTPAPTPSIPSAGPVLPVPSLVSTSPADSSPVPIQSTGNPGIVPPPPPPRLGAALAALAAGEFDQAVSLVRVERRRSPGARELDLVEASALGGRYVLEGRRDAALLGAARASLAAFRRKGGAARAEATLISPSLRTLLEPR